ncbi:MAG: malate/lactate dehydrogenase, partial [Clostridiales bacterium]|nr:malate/lactate dehydrogenase [Clostridiales bacterium]
AKDRRIGNNPLIFAVPKKEGHVVVDAAMAQFSYGNIESHKLSNKKLPVPGGYDSNGDLSTDPNEIEKTWRVLPIGYWKGSAFSIVMDLIAAVLSGGNTTHRIGMLGGDEYQLSQVFIAIDVEKIAGKEYINSCAEEIIKDIKESEKVNEAENIRYPGESVFRIRNENLAKGIPVNDDIWNKIKAM